ncbi:MAG TPA: glycoside hydrolase family 88 protein [Tepidisphaeraceae bacterium]|jgi:rhamnogalacturonyl hydrolase YesR
MFANACRGAVILLAGLGSICLAQASRPATSTTAPGYPVPYERPTAASITEVLQRVHGYLDHELVARVIERGTRQEITDFTTPEANAIIDRGQSNGYEPLSYPTGVTYSGMMLASEVTKDPRYNEFVAKRIQFIQDRLPYFRSQAEKFGKERIGGLRAIINTESLDDCGAMAAALIKAKRGGIGPDTKEIIDGWLDFISTRQFRLPDGQLARHRPQPESIWADDAYMSIPALAQMGKLTGDRKYFDDAVKQSLGFGRYLFVPEKGIYMHGRNMNQPDNPEFYWARANGWIIMANVELLDVLPEDHPQREEVLKLLRAQIKGLASYQSGRGLWHNMLDKPETYEETSASAMIVFGIARAINRGWISPVSYGSVAQAGWNALTTRVNALGQVEGTCIGTTFASENVYYFNRPTSIHAPHGYGPMLLAGAEMIRLVTNPEIDIQFKSGTFHYVPKSP